MKVGVILPMGSHANQPGTWAEVRTYALAAEAAGIDSLWAFDHAIFRFPGQAERGALEPWTVLSLLGGLTTRIELGSLVLGMRFRHPALLAKAAVTLDEAVGGRLTLGVGAGWHDPEYQAFGFPLDYRLNRTEEGFHILHALLAGQRSTFPGRFWQTDDAVLLPAPERRIPLLSSARGGRMMRIVARWADAWNGAWVARPDDPALAGRNAELDQACDEVGRDRAAVARTAGVSVRFPDADLPGPTGNREKDLMGDAAAIAAGLQAFADAGYVHAMIWPEPMTVASVERIGEALALLDRPSRT
jgi:alkanesulfonate monooxygenase SsuD/methylene tetrahydromethanopterin reductase-like flavin-dependent oxidoreductase (luciferase family)